LCPYDLLSNVSPFSISYPQPTIPDTGCMAQFASDAIFGTACASCWLSWPMIAMWYLFPSVLLHPHVPQGLHHLTGCFLIAWVLECSIVYQLFIEPDFLLTK
jgi:hypothetical protein